MKGVPGGLSPASPPLDGDVWFVHGWGESPAPFRGVLSSPLAARYRLFAPTLPGFGGRLPLSADRTIAGLSTWLVEEIRAVSSSQPVALVGHSIGGMIVTRAGEALGEQVRGVVSIEGNLLRSDAFFTGQALRFESGEELRQTIILKLRLSVAKNEVPRSYLESLELADTDTLLEVGRSAAWESHRLRAGKRWRRLDCPKVYYWGTRGTHSKTQAFLRRVHREDRCFEGCGHWLMLDREEEFLQGLGEDLDRFFAGTSRGPAPLQPSKNTRVPSV